MLLIMYKQNKINDIKNCNRVNTFVTENKRLIYDCDFGLASPLHRQSIHGSNICLTRPKFRIQIFKK